MLNCDVYLFTTSFPSNLTTESISKCLQPWVRVCSLRTVVTRCQGSLVLYRKPNLTSLHTLCTLDQKSHVTELELTTSDPRVYSMIACIQYKTAWSVNCREDRNLLWAETTFSSALFSSLKDQLSVVGYRVTPSSFHGVS